MQSVNVEYGNGAMGKKGSLHHVTASPRKGPPEKVQTNVSKKKPDNSRFVSGMQELNISRRGVRSSRKQY